MILFNLIYITLSIMIILCSLYFIIIYIYCRLRYKIPIDFILILFHVVCICLLEIIIKVYYMITPNKKGKVEDTKWYKNEQINSENTRYVIKFTPITPEEREILRIPVYNYLL